MRLSDFDYYLPKNMIAQSPIAKRDCSKLLKLNLPSGETQHLRFNQITDILRAGDVLVLNDSRVINARFFGHKPTGGKIELLVLDSNIINQPQDIDSIVVDCLVKGKVSPGLNVDLSLEHKQNLKQNQKAMVSAQLLEHVSGGRFKVKINSEIPFNELLPKYGSVPLPPYIKQELKDPERYQTIYSKNLGSIAAPTAGLHFTPELLKTLEDNGIQIAYITLHISYGTFTPVHTENITQHKMDREYAILTTRNSDIINQVYKSKMDKPKGTSGRLVAVGTTVVRTLETIALNSSINSLSANGTIEQLSPWEGWTQLFIYPGFKFKAGIDILITNFHLPKSTLLMLVTAYAGHNPIIKAYKEAIEKNYRFYSLGDSMMIIK